MSRILAHTGDEWFTPGRVLILLTLVFVAAFPEVVAGTQTFVLRDFGMYSYPVAYHWKESFWRGEIPLWNPLSYCGIPFLAQWSPMVLYPPTLLYMFLPLTWVLPMFCMAHLVLGGMGMFFLVQRWVGHSFAAAFAAVIFAYNGLTLSSLPWPHYTVAIGWMPWVVLASDRAIREGGRSLIWAAVIGAMQMLSGMPEIILLTWLVVSVVWVTFSMQSRPASFLVFTRLPTVVVMVTVFCAAQLLPFAELLGQSTRNTSFGDARWSMPATGLANFLVPLFHTFRSQEGVMFQYTQYLVPSYYLGIGAVWLGLMALITRPSQRIWALAGLGLVAVLLAMGNHAFLFPLCRSILPAIGVARYPVKFLYLLMFVLPPLAAWAIAHLSRPQSVRDRSTMIAAGLLMVCMLCGAAIVGWFGSAFPMPQDAPGMTFQSSASRAAMLTLTALACWGLAVRQSLRAGIVLRCALLAVAVVDVRSHIPSIMNTVPSDAFSGNMVRDTLQLSPTPIHGESRLMIDPAVDVDVHYKGLADPVNALLISRSIFFSNCNLLDDIPKVNGFYSLVLARNTDLMRRFYERNEPARGLKDFMGVSQYSSSTNGLEFESRHNHLPFVTAGQKAVRMDAQVGMGLLFSEDFHPADQVILSANLPPEAVSGGDIRIRGVKVRTHRIEVEVEPSVEGGWLVVAQSNYPAWVCTVDGRRIPTETANHAFQAVRLPSNAAEVVLAYRDLGFLLGGTGSMLMLMACMIWLCRIKNPA